MSQTRFRTGSRPLGNRVVQAWCIWHSMMMAILLVCFVCSDDDTWHELHTPSSHVPDGHQKCLLIMIQDYVLISLHDHFSIESKHVKTGLTTWFSPFLPLMWQELFSTKRDGGSLKHSKGTFAKTLLLKIVQQLSFEGWICRSRILVFLLLIQASLQRFVVVLEGIFRLQIAHPRVN